MGGNDSAATANHAQRMDSMYRYQRHIYDLTRKYYLLGRDHSINQLGLGSNDRLLELGCGTGRNLLLSHHRYPLARLYGLDISAEMLTSAEANFSKERETPLFRVGDATRFQPSEFGEDGFERILISYALSMIPDWERAIETALAALVPGGSLHIVDFGQQEGLPRWFRTLLHAWLARFHVTPRADLERTIARLAADCGASVTLESIGRGYACHAIIRKRDNISG